VLGLPERKVSIRHLASRAGTSRVHHAIVRLSALLAPEKLREAFFNGRVVGSSSGHYEDSDLSQMQQRARSARTRDAAGWCVHDAIDHGFMVVAPSREQLTIPRASLVVRRLGAHIATGLRLQRVISSASLEDASVEAIFDVDGRAQHIDGMARAPEALERLRQSVLTRARSSANEPDTVDPAWSAVVAGRWSLVDRFDADGRRFVVAYRNPPGVLDPRRLTPREEHVTTLAAIGRANKEIAFELGIAQSTVATLLASALGKLGLESRTLLPLFWRDLQGHAWAVTNREAALIAISRAESGTEILALTPAERAVADGLCRGLSDREIARVRNCSRHTVAKHVTAIYRKLGVRSRIELASQLSRRTAGGSMGGGHDELEPQLKASQL
jgi:DNA-binding NarL/FixJ family response regulator